MGNSDLDYKIPYYELSPGTPLFLKAGIAYKKCYLQVHFVKKNSKTHCAL
jgi:hypothetical protein